ncbi:unnamed protein product [Gadus morhua 'NCC']
MSEGRKKERKGRKKGAKKAPKEKEIDPTAAAAPRLKPMKYKPLVDAGEKLTLKCEATGNPMPSYKWYKDGKELTKKPPPGIKIKGSLKNSRLQISRAKLEHSGNYTCVVENSLGRENATRYVNVQSSEYSSSSYFFFTHLPTHTPPSLRLISGRIEDSKEHRGACDGVGGWGGGTMAICILGGQLSRTHGGGGGGGGGGSVARARGPARPSCVAACVEISTPANWEQLQTAGPSGTGQDGAKQRWYVHRQEEEDEERRRGWWDSHCINGTETGLVELEGWMCSDGGLWWVGLDGCGWSVGGGVYGSCCQWWLGVVVWAVRCVFVEADDSGFVPEPVLDSKVRRGTPPVGVGGGGGGGGC